LATSTHACSNDLNSFEDSVSINDIFFKYSIRFFNFFISEKNNNFLENFIIWENNIISVKLAPRYYNHTAYIEVVLEGTSKKPL
jgi:hypothetical protein